jgi:hypothetical protein
VSPGAQEIIDHLEAMASSSREFAATLTIVAGLCVTQPGPRAMTAGFAREAAGRAEGLEIAIRILRGAITPDH